MSDDPIRHVVLLLLENRSFDHALGALQAATPALDGVPPGGGGSNVDDEGRTWTQKASAVRKLRPDPPHDTVSVLEQVRAGNGQFVREYERRYRGRPGLDLGQVMAYHPLDSLPALHQLARAFTVCDRWFSSVPGPTWTNRLFAMSGTSLGRVRMPAGPWDIAGFHRYAQPSVFRRLREAGVPYRIYMGDFPLALLLEDQRTAEAAPHFHDFEHFRGDVERGSADFPAFAFIEPRYLWPGANDDHPPHDVLRGQRLLATVYDALRANEEIWRSTLLVVTYDEHGGFYDHCTDLPSAVPPDAHAEEFAFERAGVRVPALLVSPWVDAPVVHAALEHTSVLRYAMEKWGLGELGARAAAVASLGELVRRSGAPRADAPPRIRWPEPELAEAKAAEAAPPEPERLNENQVAILALSEHLEVEIEGTAGDRVQRHERVARSPAAACVVAEERARRFLRSRGARV